MKSFKDSGTHLIVIFAFSEDIHKYATVPFVKANGVHMNVCQMNKKSVNSDILQSWRWKFTSHHLIQQVYYRGLQISASFVAAAYYLVSEQGRYMHVHHVTQ